MKTKQVLLILLVISILTAVNGCIETGKGSSIDTIYGVEQNALGVWKVWLTNDHPTETYTAIYSMDKDDTETIEAIQAAYESGDKVKIYYKNIVGKMPFKYASGVIIYKVEAVDQST